MLYMMQLAYLTPVLLSFVVTIAGILFILRFFPKWKLMDRPHEYGLTRQPIPYSGGIIFFAVFILAVLFFVKITPAIIGLMSAATLIVIVSFLDDRFRLSPFLRLSVQLLAGAMLIFAGVKIQLVNTPFAGPLYLDTIKLNLFGQEIWLFSALAIMLWLVLMMNVMNWLDGIPGLASGVSTIAQIALFILSTRQFHIVDQSAIITISSVLAASTLAFVLFDFYPPKLLMGDTGSMFLGFMLGALSIISGGKLATALLIMGFPVIDALWVILKRMFRGTSPLRGDYSHFHHRLLESGLSPKAALSFNYLLCGVFAAIALLLHSAFTKTIAFASVLFLMGLIGLILLFRKSKRLDGRLK